MLDEKPHKNLTIIVVILVVVVLSISIIILLSPLVGIEENTLSKPNRNLTTSFTNITVKDAYELINTSQNIIIIDARSCSCKFNNDSGHIGDSINFEAIWQPKNISMLTNNTNDIIVYDWNGGRDSTDYCEDELLTIPMQTYIVLKGV